MFRNNHAYPYGASLLATSKPLPAGVQPLLVNDVIWKLMLVKGIGNMVDQSQPQKFE